MDTFIASPSVLTRHAPRASSLEALDTMAALASRSDTAVHVVVPREAGIVAHARAVADTAGLVLSVDLMAATIRVRFARR
ncbi:MAG: hypothetical protein QOF51_795 [Chloroflexota bacterium]|jgi:hypothetical protein|nr:hypothetical protein [Chloroflexota bacterium]